MAPTPESEIAAPDAATSYFGESVANAGDVNGDGFGDVIVGAYGASGFAGRAYVYLGSATGLATEPTTIIDRPEIVAHFAVEVAGAGDVNGDGYADVIVGAPGNASLWAARAYVYLGGPTGTAEVPATTLNGPSASQFGSAIDSAGDVNGDGYADVIVGALYAYGTSGAAYLYLGGEAGLSMSATMLVGSGAPNENFGFSVASAGDMNGDGFADVVAGGADPGGGPNRAYLFVGGASGIARSPTVTFAAPSGLFRYFGVSLGSAGDVNGDGLGDLIVGALGDGGVNGGAAYIYFGSASSIHNSPSVTLANATPPSDVSRFGDAAVGVGDLNGDRLADVIVGDFAKGDVAGCAYVYFGESSGAMTVPTVTLDAPDGPNSYFGDSLAGI